MSVLSPSPSAPLPDTCDRRAPLHNQDISNSSLQDTRRAVMPEPRTIQGESEPGQPEPPTSLAAGAQGMPLKPDPQAAQALSCGSQESGPSSVAGQPLTCDTGFSIAVMTRSSSSFSNTVTSCHNQATVFNHQLLSTDVKKHSRNAQHYCTQPLSKYQHFILPLSRTLKANPHSHRGDVTGCAPLAGFVSHGPTPLWGVAKRPSYRIAQLFIEPEDRGLGFGSCFFFSFFFSFFF